MSDAPKSPTPPAGAPAGPGAPGGPGASGGFPPGPRPKHKRKLSNYLLDRKLQLRYIMLVTILSGFIAGSLGIMIYQQRHKASSSIERDLITMQQQFNDKQTNDLAKNIPEQLAREDRNDALTMVGVGLGLAIILSGYLLIMTHKVAGPLYKVSMYFDKMAVGKLGRVTPLRTGDMLQDFYASFHEMHDALRARMVADNDAIEKAMNVLKESKNEADYRGEGRAKLDDALENLDKHVAERKKALA